MSLNNLVNNIFEGDCLELFHEIPNDSIDMTFADPPFNLKKKYNGYSDSLEFQAYIDWCGRWIKEMVRVTKPTGSIFIHNIPKWLTFYVQKLNEIAFFKHWISWSAPTAPMGRSLQPSHYGILFYVKDINKSKIYEIRMPHERERKSSFLLKDYGGKKASLHPFGPLVSDVWTDVHRIRHSKYRDEHPCQLPIPLLERLILLTTDEGDIVLDPFVGTGTTAVAAKKLGRRYIGFDLDSTYKYICEEKLKKITVQSKIGNSFVSFHLGEIRTLRDADWCDVKKYFEIPNEIKDIDFKKIQLKKRN